MIHYLVTAAGHATITDYLRTRGRALAGRIRPLLYEHLPLVRRLPAGTFVFADVERLSPEAALEAVAVWDALAAEDGAVRVLNHPTLSMRRFELLRALHEQGVNRADVRRVTELRPAARFPVFLRRADDHAGSLSPLLHGQDELDAAIDRLTRAGARRDDLLVTEFCDTADADGVYRKYAAFRVGDRIVPRHVLFSRDWAVKIVDRHGPAEVAEELAYVRANPHRAELMAIFERARIEFGRIDYALLGGRIQVWEINTNPILGTFQDGGMPARAPVLAHVTPALAAAWCALDDGAGAARSIMVAPGRTRMEHAQRRLRPVVEAVLRAAGLARWELAVTRRLGLMRRRWTR